MVKKIIQSFLCIGSILLLGIMMPSIADATNQLEIYKTDRKVLLNEQNLLSELLEISQGKLDSLVSENKILSEKSLIVKSELDTLQTKLTFQRKQITSLNQQIKEYRKINKALSIGTKVQKSKYNKELIGLLSKFNNLQSKVNLLVKNRTTLNEQYSKFKANLNLNRSAIVLARKNTGTNYDAVRKAKAAVSIVDSQIANMESSILDKNIVYKPKDSTVDKEEIIKEEKNKGEVVKKEVNEEEIAEDEMYYIESDVLTNKEQELADSINEYRESLGLKPFLISKSMTTVARSHVIDSNLYKPENNNDVRGIKCNLHSWSENGKWSKVCYTPDHAYSKNMWDKPRELTNYRGNGYEISVYYSAVINPAIALKSWQGSPNHNNVIIGKGSWSDLTVMGVGIHGDYSHVWFGKESDSAGYMSIVK